MQTLTFKRPQTLEWKKPLFFQGINRYILASGLCMCLFVAYFLVPHVGVIRSFFRLSLIYLLVLPLVGFVLSVIAVKKAAFAGKQERVLSYITLAVTSLYIIVGAATFLVLVGFYILYAQIL